MGRQELKLAGFGGQGIILAGYIIGKAASIYDSKNATFTQSYGPESRGGACSAQLIISDEPVHYPHIISPSIMVFMSQEAYNKYHGELQEGGLMLLDEDLVDVEGLDDEVRVLSIPSTRIAEELGRTIVANIVMLGFFSAVTEVVSVDAVREAVRTSVPSKTVELNMRAFQRGYEYGSKIAASREQQAASRGAASGEREGCGAERD
jgi:2-oxoglutarate ferredoxin oxidoreductase subunit gamma